MSEAGWKDKIRIAYEVVKTAVENFSADRGGLLASAIAFRTLLSLAPLGILAVAIAGFVLGRDAAKSEMNRVLRGSVGDRGAEAVNQWVEEAANRGGLASFVSIVIVLFAASRLFTELKAALNQIMNVDVYQSESFAHSVKHFLRRRLIAFVMVLMTGLSLLVVFASRTALFAVSSSVFPDAWWSGTVLHAVQVVVAVALVATAAAAVIKLVPDTTVSWRAAFVGGTLTSVLFNAGNALASLYLGRASAVDTYGAAGSAIVILMWVHLSAHMLLLGAEVTQAFGARFGRGLSEEEERELEEVGREASRRAAAAGKDGARAAPR
jgi:membrane protein